MGRSFRVGWGPNGVLVHCGAPVGCNGSQRLLSSVINVEKVAIDRVVRDENNNTKKDLVEFAFDSPLNLHKTINHETQEVKENSGQSKSVGDDNEEDMMHDMKEGSLEIDQESLLLSEEQSSVVGCKKVSVIVSKRK
ncbi:hypothetical protein GH714_000080 [Hevea brasiliensis]|uniref:Uncharacterized protein n=1 Tax=Hevea brasiliensis TaxID=3981 RepID=A0A6A6NB79_HEVBR|nr:hypothetical protein GH714_000080 [Hevea brasiliensis]